MSSDEKDNKNVEDNKESDVKENGVKEEDAVATKPVGKKKGGDPPKIKQPAKKRVKTEQAENKKPEKKVAKKNDEKKDADESEEDDEEEGDKAVPLLDQPLEISGNRKRKEVERFIPVSRDEESKEVRVPEGKGKLFGDIAWVDAQIQRAKPEDLKLLHRLCFGKPGKAALVKKTLRKFNGFEFEEASDEYEKKKVAVENSFKKVTVGHLKNICNILDLEKGGHKSEIIDRILSFLTKPVDSGKKFPGSGRSKRSGAAAKNYDEGEERFQSKKKGKGKKKEDVTSEAESENDEKDTDEKNESEEEVEDKKNNDSQTTEESEEEAPVKKTKAKKAVKKGKKAEKKAPPKKRATAKKAESEKEEEDSVAESEEDDDKPLAKKAKVPPTDEEIKTYVKSLLDGANLEQITMKKVCQQVYEHYPDFDLGQKKDFIKTTVKSLISS